MHAPSRTFSLLLVALLALGVTAWASHSTSAAPVRQETGVATETPFPTVTSTASETPTPTETLTPTITPTPTATPTKNPVRTEITFPTAKDVLFGTVQVEGTAYLNYYREYQLTISPANSEQWSWLASGRAVVIEGVFYSFDTRRLPDGFYDFRLRGVNQYSNYMETFVRGVEIRNVNPPTFTPTATLVLAEGELPPNVSPLETPTATPIPDTTSFVPGGQGIYKPGNGDVLKGVQPIVGTVNSRAGKRFLRYELYYSRAGMDDWQWFYASQQEFFQDLIYRLDTSRLANDRYDLRLRIVYTDSNYDEFFVRGLTVANDSDLASSGPTLRLQSPRTGEVVAGQMDIRGTLIHPRLSRWELYWSAANGKADDQREWLLLFTGNYQVLDDLIARIDLGQVVPGRYDLRVRLVQQDGNYEDAFIRRLLVALPTSTPPPAVHR